MDSRTQLYRLAAAALLAACGDVPPSAPSDRQLQPFDFVSGVLQRALSDEAVLASLHRAMLSSEYAGAELDLTDLASNLEFVSAAALRAGVNAEQVSVAFAKLGDYQLSI